MAFSLALFEQACYRRQHEVAGRELLNLLQDLDSNFGELGREFQAIPPVGLAPDEFNVNFLTRICAAISCLFSDENFQFSVEWQKRTFELHRWLSAVFASTPFHNADHILSALNLDGVSSTSLEIDAKNLHKFCTLYSQESEIEINLDGLWKTAPLLTASLCLSLMSPRFLGTRAAHHKREVLLKWLPEKLLEVDSLFDLPFGILHDVYMHCSYADCTEKHQIKKSINTLIRRTLLAEGFTDRTSRPKKKGTTKINGKPVILVVMEWFTSSHSVYRTHSLSLRALKEKFHVVGMAYDHAVDEQSKLVFDEFIQLDQSRSIFDQVRDVMDVAERVDPAIFYCPAVGMFPITIFLANLRFAKTQVVALGHGASTMATCMDYYVLDKDFIGDPACFSETLIEMPIDGMPFVPSSVQQNLTPVLRESPPVVKVAVASSLMKFNPRFLDACRQIYHRSEVPVEFHFLPGMAVGLGYVQLKNLVARYMPTAVVHPHQPYPQYMETLNQCDLYINPFPYGNMNGIADMAFQGLVGVCRTGPEVHEHIDEGIFRRLGMPEWLIASSDEEYIRASVRLIQNHLERLALRKDLLERKAVEVLYQGRPNILAEKFMKLLNKPERHDD